MLEDHNIQPKQDSNGRKVPEFEAKDISNADRNWSPPQSRPSWKTWARRSSEWGKSFASNLSNLSTSTKPFHLGRKDLWKPASLKIPVLGSLFLVSLGLIGLLEFLAHLASRNNNENDGGLTFAESEEELSNGVEFLYFYLPTIIAVLYGMVWAWIDLDVKRLEPWYQLARPEGATAENSMLLKYQFNFAGFVPHRALKRRYVLISFARGASTHPFADIGQFSRLALP